MTIEIHFIDKMELYILAFKEKEWSKAMIGITEDEFDKKLMFKRRNME